MTEQGFVFRGTRQVDALNELGVRRADGSRYERFDLSVTGRTRCGHKIWFAQVGNAKFRAEHFKEGRYFVNFVENAADGNCFLVEYCIGEDAEEFWAKEDRRNDPPLDVILRHWDIHGRGIERQTYLGAVRFESGPAEVAPEACPKLFLDRIPEGSPRDIQVMSRRWRVVRTTGTFGEQQQ